MRPPMQSAAVQQNEGGRQQQQQQHQQNQQQLLAQATAVDLAILHPAQQQQPPQHQRKLQQRDILVENHFNNTCSATKRHSSLPTHNTPTYQQHFVRSRNSFQFQNDDDHGDQSYDDDDDDEGVDDSIQLVDLNTLPHRQPSESLRNAPPSSRSSIISDCPFSRSSSSEDDASLSGDKLLVHHYTRANTFDDAAEHFIINFPADSPSHLPNDCIINLPLSETEPLLTNIEETVSDTKRAICLSKNSASLIFTKKDIPATTRYYTSATAATSNNNCTSHRRVVKNACTIGASSTASGLANSQRRHHYSLRSSNERSSSSSSNRKQTTSKHLPATYHQQQRRSLQLNYNNNLVTTSTCSANNNYCCSTGSLTGKGVGLGGAVLHKHHSGLTSPSASKNTTATTAAATRKQHAYSWYAPVYSALEEELEQDSRDSSPIHNLANTKKQHSKHYQQQQRSSHTAGAVTDNETVALLETRNQINIQAQLHAQAQTQRSDSGARRPPVGTAQVPNSLALQQPHNNAGVANNGTGGFGNGGSGDFGSYDGIEGPHAGSLGLTGGPLPRRRRFENFLKSLVGLKTTTTSSGSGRDAATMSAGTQMQLPASPEITITRTPSEQNFVIMRDPAGRCQQSGKLGGSVDGDKLTNVGGSTSSLNVVQQKLWNILRREGSAASLHQEQTTTPTIVQYISGGSNGNGNGGMRKCETVLALTRQTHSLCSPVLGAGSGIIGGSCNGSRGSGIFSANGVEQIRPLNRLRNSVASINAAATCSRCSSLLSLAASGSRYSLNAAAAYGGGEFMNRAPSATSMSQQQLHVMQSAQFSNQQQQQQQHRQSSQRQSSTISSSSLSCSLSRSCDNVDGGGCVGPSHGDVSVTNRNSSSSGHCSRKSSIIGGGAANSSSHSVSNSSSPPSNMTTTATLNSSYTPTPTPTANSVAIPFAASYSHADDGDGIILGFPSVSSRSKNASPLSATAPDYPLTVTSLLTVSSDEEPDVAIAKVVSSTSSSVSVAVAVESRPFQLFTCKLCLVDVESANEATTLLQCACEFCTECMKAYVDFEISEGAYEISCPDAQCPAQGILTLPEIANLTTANLMKKHHRYRLNREIELDKTRTWCPRAGCETVCLVGATSTTTAAAAAAASATSHSDAAPSTSTSISTNITTSISNSGAALNATTEAALQSPVGADGNSQLLCVVLCPSCKDEFCSACKKAWHPNLSCEENSRRLVADGQDDIGIPFDNDLIKCCPMCAVPIEKDEGCAQMMCKRCKHVFCWYCLASLDDDFLLRHYDKGPCKNKLGHSRASVVWHRAQVIGIFAGFGILLLVASPLLLLAAPCIICCKCRSCSGSKIDEGDGELDEATTALQS